MDKEHSEIMGKLDEILHYLKHERRTEVDEKLAMMLKCTCGPKEDEEDSCGCGHDHN